MSLSLLPFSCDNRQALFLCHFSGRQPLIHVPIIPSARGPSGPSTKDASSQASLSPLCSCFLLLSSLTCVSSFSLHSPGICCASPVGLAETLSVYYAPTVHQSHAHFFPLFVCFNLICFSIPSSLIWFQFFSLFSSAVFCFLHSSLITFI